MKRVIKANTDRWYYGKEAYEKYGDLVKDSLSGCVISKAGDEAELPGGLVYEAENLGLDWPELLQCLEGMCYNGMCREISDYQYKVL